MPDTEIQNPEPETGALFVRDAPKDLHKKIEKLASKIHFKTGEKVTKTDLIVRLLTTHPDIINI